MYDLEAERVAEEIRKRKAKRVLVQLPDGLRPHALELASQLKKKTGAEIYLSGDSCYGACDIALGQSEAVGADLLVHYGHSRMLPDARLPILYVEARAPVDVEAVVEKALPLMKGWKKVGLATTVQYAHQLEAVKKALAQRGLRAVIGAPSGKATYEGQVLGCDYGSARSIAGAVDGFLFIGGGRFHPLGLAQATGKTVVTSDPYTSRAESIGQEELRRLAMKRMAALAAAKGARRFGILVSMKPGQFDLEAAEAVRGGLEAMGRHAVIICLDEVRPENLNNFSEAEAFIDAACPRVALDGVAGLRRPILTLQEARVLLGESRWEDM